MAPSSPNRCVLCPFAPLRWFNCVFQLQSKPISPFTFHLSSAREVFLGLWNQLPLFQRAAYFTGLLSQFQLSI
jgi:hypothetical protein